MATGFASAAEIDKKGNADANEAIGLYRQGEYSVGFRRFGRTTWS